MREARVQAVSRCIRQVRDSLTQRASEFNIMVDDVAITHLSFGTEARRPSLRRPSVFIGRKTSLIVLVDGGELLVQHT